MDNKTLNLFRYSLRQVEAEIARLTEKAGDYREIIKREEEAMAATETNRAKSEEFHTMFEELLAAAEAASCALHELHPRPHRIADVTVGRGICEWKPCQALFKAIVKASQEK